MTMQYIDNDEFATLADALREQRGGVRMTTPVEQVVRRGRSLRARRRVPAAGALAAVALAAVALSGAGTGGSGAGPAGPQARSTIGHGSNTPQTSPYWSVSLAADNTIDVTVLQLRDPAGLQSLLRSDGLPVAVSFSGQPIGSTCRPYSASADLLWKVVHLETPGKTAAPPAAGKATVGTTFTFNPSALPKGVGVALYDGAPRNGSPKVFAVKIDLVHASAACTGS